MIKVLAALIKNRKPLLLEVAGSGTLIYGLAQHSVPAAWVAGGAALLLKSLEVDLKSGGDSS